nr:hypothetical protein BaRGS_018590 [Batillaria attramentaria]
MVRDLTRRLYGLNVLTSRKLDGYDDRNFHITVDEEDVQNPYLGELCPHGYVLKILNYNDSKKPAIVSSLEALITAEELSKSDKKLGE